MESTKRKTPSEYKTQVNRRIPNFFPDNND